MGAVVWPKIPKMPPEFLGQSLGLSEKKTLGPHSPWLDGALQLAEVPFILQNF